MAEIKSSLEIALERAAALAAADGMTERRPCPGRGRGQGRAAARRVMAGELAPAELARQLEAMEGARQRGARADAAAELLAALPAGQDLAMPGLLALGRAVPAAQAGLAALAAALRQVNQASLALRRELAAELGAEFAAAGLNGAALVPNPEAHPHFAERAQAALAIPLEDLERAKAMVARALAG